MGTGTRILVAVAVASLLTIAATGCRGSGASHVAGEVVSHAATGIDEVIRANASIPRPIKKALGKMAAHEAKDVISASCEVKDFSNIEQQARQDYGNLGEYKIGLIVDLAKAMQASPGASALCS